MVDVVDSATRSRMMSGIRSANTRPELKLRRALHARGLRFRLHDKSLPGRPDIVLPRWRVVIEVRGCFWHHHQGCRWATKPSTRPDFWDAKFRANVERDKRNVMLLRDAGWTVAIVWECAFKTSNIDVVADAILTWMQSDECMLEIPTVPPGADPALLS